MSAVDLSRLQFATTTIYHFLFVPVTIGLAFLTAMLHTLWYRSGDPEHLRLTRFFGTLLVINIAVGVVTGLVQEFQFGMNWSDYSRFVGDVFGAPLAMEGLAAFFLESTFLGLWLFGWDRAAQAGAPGHDLGGRGRRRAVGGVHHGRQLLDAAPGRLPARHATRDRPELTDIWARAHQPGLPLGLPARAAGLAGHRRRRHARGLGLAPAARHQRRGVRAVGQARPRRADPGRSMLALLVGSRPRRRSRRSTSR